MPLSPSTWNTLGLGVGAGFAGLSILSVVVPSQVNDLFRVTEPAVQQGEYPVKFNPLALAILIGGRDLAIGASIFSLARAGKNAEAATVILATMVVCIPDMYLVWRNKKYSE
jgi:hypothetical protein